jgi:drug/metabolite transporter (DMT)-like permease
MKPAHPLLGGVVAVLGAIAYGINIPAARVAGMGGVNGSNLAMQRSMVLVLILAIVIGSTRRSFRIHAGETRRIIAMGFFAGITGVCYLSSLTFVPVAIAVTVFYTFPLLLILAAPFTGGGRITPWRIAAFAIAFTGIMLCVGPTFEGLDWRGLALGAGASLSCAVLFTITASVKQDRLTLMFWMQVFALPVLMAGVGTTGLSGLASIGNVWLAILVSAVAFYIGFTGQLVAGGLLKPATLGLFFLIEPVVAIATAAAVLDETMLPVQYGGIALVIGGLALDVWKRSESGTISTA